MNLLSAASTIWEGHTIHEDGTPCPVEDYPATRCLQSGGGRNPLVRSGSKDRMAVSFGYLFGQPRS